MKKQSVLLLLLILVLTGSAFASDQKTDELKKFQLQNAFIGFGVGSRHQGDIAGARNLRNWDIAGTSLSISGAMGLAASIICVSSLKAVAGDVTKADIYICAGILSSGLIMLIVNRIRGYNQPLSFK